MQLSEIFGLAFRYIDEYSVNGVAIPTTDKNYIDIKNRMYGPADSCQKDLAKILKISDKVIISQNPISNLLGNAFDEIQLFPGGTYEYIVTGARSFSLEVDGDCSIQFAEYTGTWTALNGTYYDGTEKTLTGSIAVTGITGYANYRGLLTIADASHQVRMKIISTYPCKVRFRALFGYGFASALKVPWYRDFIPYDLPTNWTEFNKMMRHFDTRQFQENKDYILTPDNKIHLNWFLTGQFEIHGWKNPTTITPATLDTYAPEISDDGQTLMPYYIGGYAIMKSRPDIGVQLVNQYYELRNMLKAPSSNTSNTVVNTMWTTNTARKLF